MNFALPMAAGAAALLGIASFFGVDWDAPPVESEQTGYRGTGMYVTKDAAEAAAGRAANVVPESPWEPDPEGDKISDLPDDYKNVQVLGHLSEDQFTHFMASITEWVSPEAGCNYCHNPENMASDEVYTKIVSRRMIQMNQAINVDWQAHVGNTGVTCYTCHRGNPVPEEVWYRDIEPKPASRGYRDGQNVAGKFSGNSSLPQNALEAYLLGNEEIRVHADTALPTGAQTATTKETEKTWALMMHMSESLNANCVTCHNSRAFNDWDQSPPQRVTAWHGIRMARELNTDYMVGLTPVFPLDAQHRGPEGDVLKVGCNTCHNGVQKPLYGESMLGDYEDSLRKKTNTDVPDYTGFVTPQAVVIEE